MILSFLLAIILSIPVYAAQYFEQKLVIDHSQFLYYSSLELNKNLDEIEHIIITVSGSERNANTYADTMINLTKKLGVDKKTLVIAPYFKITTDTRVDNELTYSYEGWWIGDQAVSGGDVSSFKVMDELIFNISNPMMLPNLKSIVLTGHSAGGHLVQRYALGSSLDLSNQGIKLKYVVANPGTYAYLNAKRPTDNGFEIPVNPNCAFNRYKYGMEDLNLYMSQMDQDQMIDRYLKRDVTYFIGEKDIGEVESTCEANYQGMNRYQRGLNFKNFLDLEYSSHQHHLVTVHNVGHTQYGMYFSSESLNVIFADIKVE